MKKVIHLRSSGGMLGAERVIIELSKALPEFGFESLVVALWDEGDPYPQFLKVAEQSGLRTATVKCRGKFDWDAIRELKELCRKESADLLHCHGYKEDILGAFVRIRKVATNHNWIRMSLTTRIYSYCDALAMRFFDQLVAVSKQVRRDMVCAFVPEKKLRIIANGIDCSLLRVALQAEGKQKLRAELGLGDGPLLITVSSLSPVKGHTTLLEALAVVRDREFCFAASIVGDGAERKSLQEQTSSLLLADKVKFLGSRRDIAELLALADIFLLPSYREGLPMALLEAMAAGKAIIASDVGDVRYALADGEAGVVVAPRDVDELAQAIEQLLRDPERRTELGRKARERVEQLFSSRAMAEKYAECYRDVLQGAKR